MFPNPVNKANLVHNFSKYVYFFSLHVLGDYVPIIRRNNCMNSTLVTCHCVWMTVWYAGWNEMILELVEEGQSWKGGPTVEVAWA